MLIIASPIEPLNDVDRFLRPARRRGHLTLGEARALDDATLTALRAERIYPPMAGGSDQGGSGGDSGGGDGDGGDAGGSGDGDGDGDGDSGDGDDDDDDDDEDDDDDDDEVARLKREVAEEKRKTAEAERARKKAERNVRKAAEARRREQGNYKELYTESQKEVERLGGLLRNGNRDREISAYASKIGIKNTADALALIKLPDDVVDEDGEVDTRAVEAAVKALKKERPYLFKEVEAQTTDAGSRRRPATNRNGDQGDEGEPAPGPGRLRAAFAKADATGGS